MASPKGRVGIAFSSLPSVALPGRHCLYASSSPVAIRITFTALPITSPGRFSPRGLRGKSTQLLLGGQQFVFSTITTNSRGVKSSLTKIDLVKTWAFDLYLIFDIGFGDDVSHRRHRS
jgi:hypothetical protein